MMTLDAEPVHCVLKLYKPTGILIATELFLLRIVS